MQVVSHNLKLLWRDVGCRDDSARRVDKEEDEDLAEARFRPVGERERRHLVLIQVRERDASTSLGVERAEFLDTRNVPGNE